MPQLRCLGNGAGPRLSATLKAADPAAAVSLERSWTWVLAGFPTGLPLGHVQLYAAAVAAAAPGTFKNIWVVQNKGSGGQSAACILSSREVDVRRSNFHGKLPPPVMGQSISMQPWRGVVDPQPVSPDAQGDSAQPRSHLCASACCIWESNL